MTRPPDWLLRLQASQVAVEAGGSIVPAAGQLAATMDVALTVQISVVESQIREKETALTVTGENLRAVRDRLANAYDRLKENSQMLRNLDCVR